MKNILDGTQYALKTKSFSNGLSYYNQTYCKCTLTDSGFRIYRAPNITKADYGNVMWGGLIIKPFTYDSNALITGHSYCLMLDVSGQSTNNNEFYWSNNSGWAGSSYGLTTNPTTISVNMKTGEDFSGSAKLHYAFTVSDEVYKTCTTSYSSFVSGTSYNCYRDFKWGYNYVTTTGDLGTDMYINNIRLYDITDLVASGFNKTGVFYVGAVEEYGDELFKMQAYGETQVNNLIEY